MGDLIDLTELFEVVKLTNDELMLTGTENCLVTREACVVVHDLDKEILDAIKLGLKKEIRIKITWHGRRSSDDREEWESATKDELFSVSEIEKFANKDVKSCDERTMKEGKDVIKELDSINNIIDEVARKIKEKITDRGIDYTQLTNTYYSRVARVIENSNIDKVVITAPDLWLPISY